jgi:hypothetical protein
MQRAVPSAEGCEDCLRLGGAVGPPADVPDLRACRLLRRLTLEARVRHHASDGHPLISSFEPGEDWWWCYADSSASPSPTP